MSSDIGKRRLLARGIKPDNYSAGSSASYSIVEAQYDPVGRAYKTSNPHNSSAQYWTETDFDALGRVTKTILPDSQQTTYSYSGSQATVTDPTSKQRKSDSDALGRLTTLYEPDVNSANALTQTTSYTYTMLDALTQVSQGAQTRTYNYDGLGRLTSQTTPEGGAWSYVYNNFSLVSQRTDARGVITSYGYDTLNRLTNVSYNVGSTGVPATAPVSFTYGTNATQNNNGRLLTMTDGVGTETYSYDLNLPLVTQVQKVISGTTYTNGYQYNLAGEITQITYPSGRQVQPSYDAVGRLSALAATMNSVSTTYASGYAYSITDNVDAGRTVNYTYDALYRLKTAVTNGSVGYPQWGLSWTYDRYANRTAQSVTAGTGPSNAVTVSATTNRITGAPYTYDANGNMTNDGLNSLAYDAENHAVTSSGSTYTYDGNSLRVKKVASGATTVYVFSGAKVVAEYVNGAAVGSPTREYIYSGSALLAKIEGSGTKYYQQDPLSNRVVTDSTGTVVEQLAHFPYGEVWYDTGTEKWKFTSYERDPESGNDYAIARHYASRLGRFLSPDPIGGVTTDPQSLNLYAYSRNDPINRIDPLGRTCIFVDEESEDIEAEDPQALSDECDEEGGIFIDVENTVEVTAHVEPIDPFAFTLNDPVIFDPLLLGGPAGGNSSGPANNGFTLGIRAPGQTFNDRMQANAGNYSLLGAADFALDANGQIANNFWLGFTPASNTITNVYNAATGSLTSLL